jgi:hypothetical protein
VVVAAIGAIIIVIAGAATADAVQKTLKVFKPYLVRAL